jgi:hypothetical protein
MPKARSRDLSPANDGAAEGCMMSAEARDTLVRQFEIAWALASFHLEGLTTEQCLWRPAGSGPHVRRDADGVWRADWPDRESYDLGPPSIAWLTWHIVFWWSMALDHSFDKGELTRQRVDWPGDAPGVKARILALATRWREELARLPEAEFASPGRTRWPFTDRPFIDVVAWVNVELTKNAAELGYALFLHGVAGSGGGDLE